MSYVQKRGQNTAWKNSLMRNLASELIKYNRLEITQTRAKELRKHVDWLITLAKNGSLHARRQAIGYLRDIKVDDKKQVIDKLFLDLSKKYATRNGGYTRILKTKNRRGDNALLAIIELV